MIPSKVVEETASVQSVAPVESREFDPLGQMNQDQVWGQCYWGNH